MAWYFEVFLFISIAAFSICEIIYKWQVNEYDLCGLNIYLQKITGRHMHQNGRQDHIPCNPEFLLCWLWLVSRNVQFTCTQVPVSFQLLFQFGTHPHWLYAVKVISVNWVTSLSNQIYWKMQSLRCMHSNWFKMGWCLFFILCEVMWNFVLTILVCWKLSKFIKMAFCSYIFRIMYHA